MRASTAWFVAGTALLIAAGACGGESTGDGSGGATSGGAAGVAGAGGVGGKAGAAGKSGSGGISGCASYGSMDCWNGCAMYSPTCVDGDWVCAGNGPPCDAGLAGCGGGGAMDCVDPCDGHMYLPTCVDGGWTCTGGDTCDAGTDAAACTAGTVPTIEGCLTCAEAASKLTAQIEAARVANAGCTTDADCKLTSSGTACMGACPIAVSTSGESSFQAALAKLDGDYCTGFVPECGYSTPSCAVPTLACTAGLCQAT